MRIVLALLALLLATPAWSAPIPVFDSPEALLQAVYDQIEASEDWENFDFDAAFDELLNQKAVDPCRGRGLHPDQHPLTRRLDVARSNTDNDTTDFRLVQDFLRENLDDNRSAEIGRLACGL